MSKAVDKLESVDDFFLWRSDPEQKIDVEKHNIEKIKCLGWVRTDVLYSFLGIYAIGVWVYNRKLFKVTSYMIKREKQNIYSESFLHEIQNSTEYDLNGLNNVMKEFLLVYSSIGNVIPIWPGGNVEKGKANIGCFDIPERYFSDNYEWFLALRKIYRSNIYLDGIIDTKTLKNKKYKDLKSFLETIDTPKKYEKYVERICEKINDRSDNINQWICEKAKEVKNIY